jgi:hypothetical protein
VLAAPAALFLPRAAPADVYAALLAEEHAAIHLYGLVAPRLSGKVRDYARAAYDDHRRHRDVLVDLIRRDGGTPPPARLSYAIPGSLATPNAAHETAIAIEDSLTIRWRAAAAQVEPRDRRTVCGAYGDEAEHLAIWTWTRRREVADFPGR